MGKALLEQRYSLLKFVDIVCILIVKDMLASAYLQTEGVCKLTVAVHIVTQTSELLNILSNTRKGRVDEIIYVGLPDEEARKELLEIELMKRPHEDIDTAHIVELTKGYSSSDISFIVKECARCSFEESVKAKHLVKINQTLLEKTIAETRPSVT